MKYIITLDEQESPVFLDLITKGLVSTFNKICAEEKYDNGLAYINMASKVIQQIQNQKRQVI